MLARHLLPLLNRLPAHIQALDSFNVAMMATDATAAATKGAADAADDNATTQVHPVSRAGFGARATGALGAYEAARPGYPDAALLDCFARLGLVDTPPVAAGADASSAGAAAAGAPPAAAAPQQQQRRRPPRVLDLAAGTGKLTRRLADLLLLAAAAPTAPSPGGGATAGAGAGAAIVAAEPNEGMLEGFGRLCPDVPAVRAEAAALPFDDGEFDAVFVGQGYHWFANEAATREIARVIRPGGGLALLWNMEDGREQWMRELMDILRPRAAAAGVPSYVRLLDLCQGFAPQLEAVQSDWFATLFDVAPSPAAHSRLFPWRRPVTRSAVWLRVLSTSFVSTLPEAEREGAVRRKVDAWLARHAARFEAAPPRGGGGGGQGGGSGQGGGGGSGSGGRHGEEGNEPVALFDMVTEAFVVRKR